jgi:hypothetical protein
MPPRLSVVIAATAIRRASTERTSGRGFFVRGPPAPRGVVVFVSGMRPIEAFVAWHFMNAS